MHIKEIRLVTHVQNFSSVDPQRVWAAYSPQWPALGHRLPFGPKVPFKSANNCGNPMIKKACNLHTEFLLSWSTTDLHHQLSLPLPHPYLPWVTGFLLVQVSSKSVKHFGIAMHFKGRRLVTHTQNFSPVSSESVCTNHSPPPLTCPGSQATVWSKSSHNCLKTDLLVKKMSVVSHSCPSCHDWDCDAIDGIRC